MGTVRTGQVQHQALPSFARAHPAPEEQAATLLCACTASQCLPWQQKQVTLHRFAALWLTGI